MNKVGMARIVAAVSFGVILMALFFAFNERRLELSEKIHFEMEAIRKNRDLAANGAAIESLYQSLSSTSSAFPEEWVRNITGLAERSGIVLESIVPEVSQSEAQESEMGLSVRFRTDQSGLASMMTGIIQEDKLNYIRSVSVGISEEGFLDCELNLSRPMLL